MTPTATHPGGSVLLWALLGVAGSVVLIARFRTHPFIALMLASLAMGLGAGLPLGAVAKIFQEGVGNTLGFLAVVVGLGMMLGKMLAVSGGARVLARGLTSITGERNLPIAMMFLALIVGIPVLFTVGLMLLLPIVYAIAREAKQPLLKLAIPSVAGLSVSQGLLPPHPGPMLAIQQVGADAGRTILYGCLVGIPTAFIVGPLFGTMVARRLRVEAVDLVTAEDSGVQPRTEPRFGLTLLTVLLPVLLMLLAALADLALPRESSWRQGAAFLGHPFVALLVAVLLATYTFGWARGFTSRQVAVFLQECVGPAAGILLIIGAGGGFSRMLDQAGAGAAVAEGVAHYHLSPLICGWLVAASVRVSVGSATVAITMASAIMAPVAAATTGLNREWLVLAMGAGSLFLSHVNDAGFWLVKESFHLTVAQTLKTWTVLETGIGIIALTLILILSRFI